MSSCLLPPFNCQPDSSSVRFRSSYHLLRNKEPVCFLTKCVASTASILTPTTSALDADRLMLPSFESTSGSFISDRQWTYRGLVGPPTQAKLESVLASETLLTSHEAVIAAASAETVALAKAAVKLARDTALIYNIPTAKADNFCSVSSTSDKPVSKWGQFTEKELAGIIGDSIGDSAVNSINVLPGDLELGNEEIELLEEEACECIAVRSNKQTERRRKRARATEKVSSTVMPVKSGSSGRRKRPSVQEVNHSDLLRYLRGTASNSKLLTVKDEVELSEGIQVLLKLEMLQKELAEKCGGPPTFAQWAAAAGVDQKTLRKRINHGVLCKDKMIRCNIRLVISIAKNYQGAGMNLQDLVQEGCRGLVRGAEKFDASKGFKFATYAHWWIKQAVRKFLSDQSRTIRLPFHMVEATFRVKEARKKLYSEIGRQPNDEEVAAATGLSMKRLRTVLLIPKAPRSLDEKFGINLDLKPSEVIADPRADTPEEILLKQIMRQDLEKALDNLRPREKQVIKWRFGVEAGRVKTLQEIGELIGVSRERVRQIETSAFRKLTNKKRSKHLQQYLVALH